MADAPPPGPPPPRVPPGWKAVWNAQYSEWFFVNTYTKQSQWDKPTEPAFGASGDAAPSGPPPGYAGSGPGGHIDEKRNPNNPYNHPDTSSDAELAARLQAEENARRSGGTRGASDSYYNSSAGPASSSVAGPPAYAQSQDVQQQGEGSRGLLGKLTSKLGGSHKPPQGQGYPQQGGYGQQAGYGPQPGYGGYSPQPPYQQGPYGPPQQYSGYPPQGYGGYPPQGGYGGPPQPQYVQQQQPKKSGIGAGGLALGVGGGLVGGMLLEDAIQDHDQSEYQQGYDQGYDQGDDYGGGGGDMGGGDF